jgi:hypothetical protein
MQAMLEYLIDEKSVGPDGQPYLTKEVRGKLTGVKKRLDRISALSQLRNQSIIAHGFAGVSRERLAEACGGNPDSLVDDLKKIAELLGLNSGDSPFDQIGRRAVEHIRRLK